MRMLSALRAALFGRRVERCVNCRKPIAEVADPIREEHLVWCSIECQDLWVEWWTIR
jgi:hypothetical protein